MDNTSGVTQADFICHILSTLELLGEDAVKIVSAGHWYVY